MDFIHVYCAIKRKKENIPEHLINGPVVIRESDIHEDTISLLKESTKKYPGIWRIYKSVNKRDVKKSELELVKTLIDKHRTSARQGDLKPVPRLWKTILMQPRNKAERKYLIDIDNVAIIDSVKEILTNYINDYNNGQNKQLMNSFDTIKTPNGYHIIIEPFDVRILNHFSEKDCSINKDGLLFIERYTV